MELYDEKTIFSDIHHGVYFVSCCSSKLVKNHALSSYGGTHSVKPYSKKNGTYVPEHRAGNPNSGIHCHNNVCY